MVRDSGMVLHDLKEMWRMWMATVELDEQFLQAASLQRSLQNAWRYRPWARRVQAVRRARRVTWAVQRACNGVELAGAEVSNHQATNRSIIIINRLATRKLAETSAFTLR